MVMEGMSWAARAVCRTFPLRNSHFLCLQTLELQRQRKVCYDYQSRWLIVKDMKGMWLHATWYKGSDVSESLLSSSTQNKSKERRREGRPTAEGQGHDPSSASKHYSRLSSPHDLLAAVFDSQDGGGRFSEAPVRLYQITRRQIRYFITFKKVQK